TTLARGGSRGILAAGRLVTLIVIGQTRGRNRGRKCNRFLFRIDVQPDSKCQRGRERDDLLQRHGRAPERGDAVESGETGGAPVAGGSRRDEGAFSQRGGDELAPRQDAFLEARILQTCEPQVRVVELAVDERDTSYLRLWQLDRRRPAIDEPHPFPSRFGE